MKKITFFAVAALAASQAFAAAPARVQNSNVLTTEKAVVKKAFNAELPVYTSGSRAEATTSTYPAYQVKGAYYLGMNQERRTYVGNFGFLPATGTLQVDTVFSGCEDVNYTYSKYYSKPEKVEIPFDAEGGKLETPIWPLDQFIDITANYKQSGIEYTYCDSVVEYFAGWIPFDLGIYTGDDEENPELSGMVGVTPFPYTHYTEKYNGVKAGGWYTLGQSGINKTGEEGYDENGIYAASWYDYFGDEYANLSITGYGYDLPASTSPFLLNGMYAWISYIVTAETTIEVNFYPYTEDGKISNKSAARGYLVLTPGANPLDPEVSDIHLVEVKALNSSGLMTNRPLVVDQDFYISFSGVDAETVKSFDFIYNCTFNPAVADYKNAELRAGFNKMLPKRALLEFSGEKNGEAFNGLILPNPWYYNNNNYALIPNEFAIYFITDYPYIANALATTTYGDMSVKAPIEGGDCQFYFRSNYDFMQLVDDFEIEESQEGDWFTYELVYDEAQSANILNITAEALPEGVEGREGTINFVGYGYDAEITVTQGDPDAGISSIVADKAKQGKVFDLQGRAVKNASKGIFIVDGVKTFLR